MTDFYNAIVGSIVFMISSAQKAPITVSSVDQTHGLRAFEDMDANVRFQVVWDHLRLRSMIGGPFVGE